MGLPQGPFLALPEPASWFLLGRHAVVALLRSSPRRACRLWVPSYFCFEVAEYWKSFIEVVTYADDPRRAEPDWLSLRPTATDLVIAVNYFGLRNGKAWQIWRDRTDCVLVEDHSHDPVSCWALQSQADYAFASLRKTLPVPDGGILWSPRGLALPGTRTCENAASTLKLAAMLWKQQYLAGAADPEAKLIYRAWQQQGEKQFDRSEECSASSLSQQYLRPGVPTQWRQQRATNARQLLSALANITELRPVFSQWPTGAAPLGAVFEFESQARRDVMRRKLQDHRVYCPVHWPPAGNCDPAACALAQRLLTIPTDQRYVPCDMEKIAAYVRNP